ncbi:hypothetical protein ACFFTM_02020 [Pseudoduganella plicata]|uniref:Secreted protein n=1 Tax=Pseudoduganella plicata TaxID=321984 RepID=A0A4P7BGS7_9BURK|nr:hypothetical protein [Pseudoduganella plicata]QBQ36785.1 hypothetical protein E1742_11865 [Pseudoduganella plicata]GGY72754.1 hypothetical protein GCM10007388_00980 [Pseudoduganella plicata]
MNGKFTLGLLLLMAGGLIYAAAHQERDATRWSGPRDGHAEHARMAHASRHGDMSWLGPARRIDGDELAQRTQSVMSKLRQDMAAAQDPAGFECRHPAEVGPVPSLDAVDAWLGGLPASRHDRKLMRNLYRAAAEGNWLARAQVYALLSERPARDNTTAYRTVQLMEWLQEHGIGALHGIVGEALKSTGSGRPDASAVTVSDIYAALHHSYPAQHKVGRELSRSEDPRLAAAGRRMVECAAHALPAFERMFEVEMAQAGGSTRQ